MRRFEDLLQNLFLLAIFLFKLPNFYVVPIKSAFFTGQAISRVIFLLVFIYKISQNFLYKKALKKRNHLLITLISFFLLLQSLSIISATNIISFIVRYKEIIVGFVCFFDFYFYKRLFKKIISVFLISIIINYLYQFLILFGNNQTISIIGNFIYHKHWQVVSQKLSQSKLQIDVYDEAIVPFLLIFIKKNRRFYSLAYTILFLLLALFSFLSNIRSRIFMFIFGFFLSLFFIKKIKKEIVLLLFLFVFLVCYISNFIALGVLKYSFLDRVFLLTTESKDTIVSRIDQMRLVVDIGTSSIFGVGLGNYYDNLPLSIKLEKYLYPKKQVDYIGAIGAVEFVHNIFGLTIVESGYISLIIFILILISFIKKDLFLLKKGDDYQKSFIISFWTLFVLSLFNPPIPGSYSILFWGIRGLLF